MASRHPSNARSSRRADWHCARLQAQARNAIDHSARSGSLATSQKQISKFAALYTAGIALIAWGSSLLFLAFATPWTCGGCLSDDAVAPPELPLAAASVSLLLVFVLLYRSSRQRRWANMALVVALYNTLGFPAVVTVLLRSTASAGMPALIFTFWSSIALVIVLALLMVWPLELTSFAKATVGGGIGLGGVALLLTQFGAASEGYEAVIPVIVNPGETQLVVRDDIDMIVRFDSGFVQKAYFEKGLLRVTKPPYYRELVANIKYPSISDKTFVIVKETDDWRVYAQAMKGLITLGLVRQYDVNIGTDFRDGNSNPVQAPPSEAPPT